MPEDLSPEVYVEEVSYRQRAIEGVKAHATGFVGPARFGPLSLVPGFVNSLSEFERIYGDGKPLVFDNGETMHNYLWHAGRAFFAEGGRRLYITRIFRPLSGTYPPEDFAAVKMVGGLYEDGHARQTIGGENGLRVRARFPGAAGNFKVRFTLHTGQSAANGGSEGNSPSVTLDISIHSTDGDLHSEWKEVSLDSFYAIGGAPGSPGESFLQRASHLAAAQELPIVISFSDYLQTGRDVLQVLLDASSGEEDAPTIEVVLEGGNDGARPSAIEYEGAVDEQTGDKTGLKLFEDIEEIASVAAPGSTFGYENNYRADADQIINSLISHATRLRYRIAIIDSGDRQSLADVRAMRAKFDSSWAAFYYPWIRILDPITQGETDLPPSGFVAGIYARNDLERGISKAPANAAVKLAIGLEMLIDKSQQDVLNLEGINCFRFFEGRGFLLWGARLMSSDPEWKYVNLRRYLAYLEHSIDKGTQWVIFEPNDERLWSNIRRTVEDFLLSEWQKGALFGNKPEQAFFVRCDRTTMTQNDIENGRLVCLIGVAPLKPAEFVLFRIGQWTRDRKS
jgi:phage tail sheath protein FI